MTICLTKWQKYLNAAGIIFPPGRTAAQCPGLEEAPFYLSPEFASTAIETVRVFANQPPDGSDRLKLSVSAAARYAVSRARIHDTYLRQDRNIMAKDFRRESQGALEHCMRHFNVPKPKWAATTTIRVGHWICCVPRWYGVDVLTGVLAAHESNALTWDHLAQFSLLAECGPPVVPKPYLVPWLEPTEGMNATRTIMWENQVRENRKLWQWLADDIGGLARRTAELRWTPYRLEREIYVRLGKRPRGRPRKRVVDPDAPIHIADIPTS